MPRGESITLIGRELAARPAKALTRSDRVRRIGVLMGYPEDDPHAQANVTALRQGLQALGWAEDQNVAIDYRWAGADPDKLGPGGRQIERS